MRTRSSIVALALLASVVLAGEAEKPRPANGPSSVVSEDELDKPSKAGVPPPQAIPVAQVADGAKKEEGKGAKPKHVNPFRKRGRKPKYALPARITYSDGKVLEGHAWRRGNWPIRIFNRVARAHQDFYLSDLQRIDVKPESENFERDWRWKSQGSSEKVYLDIGYFWNQYITTFTTTDNEKIAGDCSGQFYLLPLEGKKTKWYLFKRQSGRNVQKGKREELDPLVYIKSVEFTDDFLKKAKGSKDQPEAGADKGKVKPASEKTPEKP